MPLTLRGAVGGEIRRWKLGALEEEPWVRPHLQGSLWLQQAVKLHQGLHPADHSTGAPSGGRRHQQVFLVTWPPRLGTSCEAEGSDGGHRTQTQSRCGGCPQGDAERGPRAPWKRRRQLCVSQATAPLLTAEALIPRSQEALRKHRAGAGLISGQGSWQPRSKEGSSPLSPSLSSPSRCHNTHACSRAS